MIDASQRSAGAVINGQRFGDHVGLAILIARRFTRYAGAKIDEDDLVQAALIGLWRGLQKFDPSRGVKVSTYVTHWIRASVQRCVCDHSRTIRVPVHRWRRGVELPPDASSLDALDLVTGLPRGDSIPSDAPGAEVEAIAAERAAPVREALAALPERQRGIVVANVVDGSTLEDIGRNLPCPISRERARQLRNVALHRLREEIDSRHRSLIPVASRTNTAR